jgi:hypothetical protein
MFEPMKAVFSLGDDRSPEAIEILCEALKTNSVLLKHRGSTIM